MRAAAAKAERRRRLMVIGGSALAVLVVIGAIVAVGISSRGKKASTTTTSSTAAAASVVSAISSVPASTAAAVGKGTAISLPQPIKATALVSGGKPAVLYVGAEYCPYCAAERWALVQALSRFGTFHNLGATKSSARDVFPNTPTFSFHGSTYTSDYLSFTGKEIYSNEIQGNGYAPLDTLTSNEQDLFTKFSPNEAFPFVDLGGRYVINSVQYDNKVLEGLTMTQIADALADPTSPVAKAVVGSANTLAAAMCNLTGGRPANSCDNPAVSALRGQLGG
jgi:hypothetical protein